MILIIDDSSYQRRQLKEILAKYEIPLKTASSYRKACQIVVVEKPMAIIVNFSLAYMSGLNVITNFSQTTFCENVPMFLGLNTDNSIHLPKDCGVEAVLSRPYKSSEVLDVLNSSKLFNTLHLQYKLDIVLPTNIIIKPRTKI